MKNVVLTVAFNPI